MIVDAHMHLMEHIATFCGRGEGRPIGGGKIRFATGEVMQLIPDGMGEYGFSAESCIELMDKHNIDISVLLQSGFYGFQNEYVVEVSKKYPGRFYPVGGLDPFCKDKTDILDNLIDRLKIRALKFEISQNSGIYSYHPGFKVDGPEMQEIFERAEQNNMAIAFDIGGPDQIGSYQIQEWKRMFDKYKGIRFVVCHLLVPKMRNQPHWEEEIKMLATDNAWFDFAALPFNIREPYPFPTSIEHVEKVAKIAGTDRLLWGSDAPFVVAFQPYEELKDFICASKKFTPSDIDKMMGENARTAYQIPKNLGK